MKLESEADSSLCLIISSEREGCSTDGGFAQASSIGREANGRSRGCGAPPLPSVPPSSEQQDGKLNGCNGDVPGLTSLNCEHFRFIDDEEEDGEDNDCEVPSPSQLCNVPNGIPEERHLLPDENSEEQVEVNDKCEEKLKVSPVAEMCDAKPNGVAGKREIKGVLKKGKRSERKQKKARVTFDEAVTLYSDEFDEVQLLALRSAAEVNCAEVFYMFEPPIEYQDMLQPFEPPAEYRDIIIDTDMINGEPLPVLDNVINVDANVIPPDDVPEDAELEYEKVNEGKDGDEGIDSRVLMPADGGGGVDPEKELPNLQQPQRIDPAEESEKLFERFLEAEREFDEDEELNRVFHVLENDLANDEKSGTLDDNFFKKLINLLSAVEGDGPIPEGDFFTTTDFTVNEEDTGKDTEDDDQTPSRTLSEADSDCSVSSQDTIIVRLVDDDGDAGKNKLCRQNSQDTETPTNSIEDSEAGKRIPHVTEIYDEVFSEELSSPTSATSSDDVQVRVPNVRVSSAKVSEQSTSSSGNLSRESSGEQPPKDTIQDADDSTSSDSRSGEVEEDIKLDDIGYDEEDADDYDEECLRGMVRGNSKIRRIIKKNALQCTLFRGIEARRRQQPGVKYPRPKSPPLSQESLVEQLKWLTTVDDKDVDNFAGSKPPDVILSTGSIPLNGSVSSSENDFNAPYRHPAHYLRHVVGQDGQSVQYHVPAGYPMPPPGARQIRPWIGPANHSQVPQQFQRPVYPAPRAIVRPMPSQMGYPEEYVAAVSPMPRDYRDWRVIQRGGVAGNYPADPQRCPNGTVIAYRKGIPAQSQDELEQFVQQGSQRIERIRKRYSVAEEDDDPTFGFARRPSVRGVQNRLPPSGLQYLPSDMPPEVGAHYLPAYASVDGQGSLAMRGARNPPEMAWSLNAVWRQTEQSPAYCSSTLRPTKSPGPIPVHRASVALTELSGCATLPHSKTQSDPRYHSYAENMYSGSQTLPHKRWNSVDPRTCMVSPGASPHQLPRLQGPPVAQPMLQVPQIVTSDERGVPEGASSSPKVSSDSLYHDTLQEGPPHKDDGVIYYSMNV